MATADIIGWIGMLALISGYGLVSARGRAPGPAYQVLNLIGSFGMLVNGVYHGAWPTVGLNIVWAAVGIVSLARLLYRRRHPTAASPATMETDVEAVPAPAVPAPPASPEPGQ